MGLVRYIAKRLAWMVPSLLGITVVTFLLMDLAPRSRADILLDQGGAPETSNEQRAAQIMALRTHWGMIDPATGVERSVWERYGQWLKRACTLDFAGPGESRPEFYSRIARALPITVFLNVLAILVALGLAIPLGARLGMSSGKWFDRTISGALFLAYGIPEFLLAALLIICLGGGLFDAVFPTRGLWSDNASELSLLGKTWDLTQHLILPTVTLALAPFVIVTRFLRESVGRAARSDFAFAMRAWGLPEKQIRRRALHNGMSPIVTLLGVLLPALVGGSVVVENAFSIPGLGRLAFDAAMRQEHSMVMAMTLLVGAATLLSFLLSDVLHRIVDPRVELR